jgi:hypothetical protein
MACGEIMSYEIEQQLEIKFRDTLRNSIEAQVITDTAHVLRTIRRLANQGQIELPPANRPIRVLGRVNPGEVPGLIDELRRLGSDQGESSGSGLASAPIPEAMEVSSRSLLLTAPEIMGASGELENEAQNATAWAQPSQTVPTTVSAPEQKQMQTPEQVPPTTLSHLGDSSQ